MGPSNLLSSGASLVGASLLLLRCDGMRRSLNMGAKLLSNGSRITAADHLYETAIRVDHRLDIGK